MLGERRGECIRFADCEDTEGMESAQSRQHPASLLKEEEAGKKKEMERQSVKVSSLWSLCKLSRALPSTVGRASERQKMPFDHVRLKERAHVLALGLWLSALIDCNLPPLAVLC